MSGLLGTGLRLTFASSRSPIVALAVGLAFGAWMAIADTTVFADAVPDTQRIAVAEFSPLERIVAVLPRVILDEIVLRLLCSTGLVALFIKVAGKQNPWSYVAPMILVATVAYPLRDYAYFASLEWSGLTLNREIGLHIMANLLWVWLYWRHGFLAAVTGHCAAHFALQPLLTWLA
ncbi:MAG: hypothetical protein B7Z08_05535 [Sphingomonadales bacterium 32-68-7]|nr:MAG: hypothetical protein B7Z33_03740 [Sphingomonadales bacterium 12-68-11]OYX09377.1 MAG: hypothetical protein B7Z08_05535 [Sphingomonadales bacterium 32-68-7]